MEEGVDVDLGVRELSSSVLAMEMKCEKRLSYLYEVFTRNLCQAPFLTPLSVVRDSHLVIM